MSYQFSAHTHTHTARSGMDELKNKNKKNEIKKLINKLYIFRLLHEVAVTGDYYYFHCCFLVLTLTWTWFHFIVLLMSHLREHLDVQRVWSIWRTLMSHSWMNSAKNVNVLAPTGKIFSFSLVWERSASRAPALPLQNNRKLLDHVRGIKKKKKKVGSWHTGVIIQLVDAENYSNINSPPGSNHKHRDEAKTEVPAGLETDRNLHRWFGEATWESRRLCVMVEANPRWWIAASMKLLHCTVVILVENWVV